MLRSYEASDQWGYFNCHWVQTHRDGSSWRKIWYFFLGTIDFLLRLPFYNIVHIHTADYGTERRKRFFAKLVKLCGRKLIIHLHSSGVEYSIGGQYRDLYVYSFTHADKILLLSNTWKDEAKKAFNLSDDKLEVVYNPCPRVIPSMLEKREHYILFAGTLTHRKGYDDLIKAFAIIADKFPFWRLKLAGNKEILQGRCLSEALGIGDRVDFLGWVSGNDKDNVFRHASIYCLPSYSEGFPMGVLDAFAYGLPVITTPVGGIPDVAKDGENMLIFIPGDVNALAAKLELLISDTSLRAKISEASRELAATTFNIDRISSQLGAIYKSLLPSSSVSVNKS